MSDSDDTHAKTQQLLQLMWNDMKELGRTLYAKIDSKIDGLDAKLSARIDAVDAKLSSRIAELDQRLSARIEGTNEKFGLLHAELAASCTRT